MTAVINSNGISSNTSIRCICLGAGREVGRSCVLVELQNKRIMFDCGIHMSNQIRHADKMINIDKLYEFLHITPPTNNDIIDLTQYIDCVVITHFHLDHIGSLPMLTEKYHYNGPIYTTAPTIAVGTMMLEDMIKMHYKRKRTVYNQNDYMYSINDIKECMHKITVIPMYSTINVSDTIKLTVQYAGHVIGAAMFYVQVGSQSILYTGDYNTADDSHLAAAHVTKTLIRPDLLITESTYATTSHDDKMLGNNDAALSFVKQIADCVLAGGKVLIPIFAIGKTTELCCLLDGYWRQHPELSHIPIYFSAGIASQTNNVYRQYLSYCKQEIQDEYIDQNTDVFGFSSIKQYTNDVIDTTEPCVVLSTPGMLLHGLSLRIFSKWCNDSKNMVVLPGYCYSGTVGNKVVSGMKTIQTEIDNKPVTLNVQCQIQYMAFSSHADGNGIMQFIRYIEPHNVTLVHGEGEKMLQLQQRILNEIHIHTVVPHNFELMTFDAAKYIPAQMERRLLYDALNGVKQQSIESEDGEITDNNIQQTVKFKAKMLVHTNGLVQLVQP